jgi:hypothetical protein
VHVNKEKLRILFLWVLILGFHTVLLIIYLFDLYVNSREVFESIEILERLGYIFEQYGEKMIIEIKIFDHHDILTLADLVMSDDERVIRGLTKEYEDCVKKESADSLNCRKIKDFLECCKILRGKVK